MGSAGEDAAEPPCAEALSPPPRVTLASLALRSDSNVTPLAPARTVPAFTAFPTARKQPRATLSLSLL